MNNKIAYDEFIDKSSKEMGTFMFKFARDKDVALFANMAGLERPKNERDIPFPCARAGFCHQRTEEGVPDRILALYYPS